MGVSVLFDLVYFSGNTCCFHLVSKFHDLHFLHPSLYQNGLLMTISRKGLAEEDKSLALKKEVNFDTQLSDRSAAEMRESGR